MAGRIPQKFIDDILDRSDIVEIIDKRVQLKKTGRNYSACCPFHQEKTPSFSVNPDKQFYYCFGCGAGGNVIGFLMDYERMEFPQAVEALAGAAGLEVPREAAINAQASVKAQNAYSILGKAENYFAQQLRQHSAAHSAIDYMKNRGLTGQIAQKFHIGFAPPGWDNQLKALANDDSAKQLLIETGMLVENKEEGKCYDRFRNRVIFPIRDTRGRVIAFGGRVLDDSKPKYLNSPESSIFHKGRELYGLYEARQANRQLQRVIIVEGYMDVVALAQHNISYAVATLGTATSTDHLKRLFRFCESVVFCFDGDSAGRRAAERALENALPELSDGRSAHFLFLPEGEDPDSLVRKVGGTSFEEEIDTAVPLEQFLFESSSQGIDLNTLEGKAQLSKRAGPMINRLPDGVFKQLMLDSLAQKTGLSQSRLEQLITPAPKPAADTLTEHQPNADSAKPVQRPQQKPPVFSKRDPWLYALALTLHQPKAALRLDNWHLLKNSSSPHAQLLIELITIIHNDPSTSTYTLLGHGLGKPSGQILSALLGAERHIPEEGIEQELIDTITFLLQRPENEALNDLVDSLRGTNFDQLSADEKQRLKLMLEKRMLNESQKPN